MSLSRRSHLRAPMKGELVYQSDEYCLKGKLSNISEGGLLLKDLQAIPEEEVFMGYWKLLDYPVFRDLPHEQLMGIENQNLNSHIICANLKMVRKFDQQSSLETLFDKNIGCQFYEITPLSIDRIKNYVSNCGQNIIYILGLFESSSKKKNMLLIEHLAKVLGYECDSVPLLRAKMLHVYQSLESL